MDEIMIDQNRKLKVITQPRKIPRVIENQSSPLITRMVTICADGSYLHPFIILPNKKTLPNIENFVDDVFTVSTINWWMNKDYLVLYILYLGAL